MHNNAPLMPKATAIWLIDNTTLSFLQIANFCKLHLLEIKAIADGESAQGIKGLNPILSGQLTCTELEYAQNNPNYNMKILNNKFINNKSKKKQYRYTPLSKRQDRPNAILWLLRKYPELKNKQIIKLVGTTKITIDNIKNRNHWNSSNLTPADPVALGLCTQLELDSEIKKLNYINNDNNSNNLITQESKTLSPLEGNIKKKYISLSQSKIKNDSSIINANNNNVNIKKIHSKIE